MYTNPQDFQQFRNSGGPNSAPPAGPYGPQGTSISQSAPQRSSTQSAPAAKSSPKPVDTVKLYTNPREREMYDNMADLFSIIRTTEALEKAYMRNAISGEEYQRQCSKLISQFKAASHLTADYVPNIKNWMADYRLDCKAAVRRLIDEGIPMMEGGGTGGDTARVVAETVQFFITLMDSLKLNMTAVDQVHPLLTDLYESLCKILSLPPDWEGKIKIKNWLVIMNQMKAADELNEEQIRQMLFDLESSYNAFHKSLSKR